MQQKLNYNGLIMVDLHHASSMDDKNKGSDELLAFQTGNDLIISPEEVGPAIRRIKRLIKKEETYETLLNNSVRKILSAKFDAGLWRKPVVITDNLVAKLNSPEAKVLRKNLYESAVTVIKDDQQFIPISTLENRRFMYVSTSQEAPAEFYHYLTKYAHATQVTMSDGTNAQSFLDSLKEKHVIVIGVFPQTPLSVVAKLSMIAQRYGSAHDIIICDFGNENVLWSGISGATFITGYAATPEALRAVPQIIFGGMSASGLLPYTISEQAKEGTGVLTENLRRLTYSIPEDARMSTKTLSKIEAIVKEAI